MKIWIDQPCMNNLTSQLLITELQNPCEVECQIIQSECSTLAQTVQ